MELQKRLYFRDAFRRARAKALGDAEGFDELLFTLERFGAILDPKAIGLWEKGTAIAQLAAASSFATALPKQWPEYHSEFAAIYNQLREARNDALHEGASARHLTSHAVVVALVLEDALMKGLDRVGDYMVRIPACACMWHPLSFIRQTLLANSFSFLPVNAGSELKPEWKLISDCSLAGFLRESEHSRSKRLGLSLAAAVASHGLSFDLPYVCTPDVTVQKALKECRGLPVLIASADQLQLLGIATPFDLL